MKATKENIIEYLKNLKSELKSKGINKIGLFGSFAKGEENIYSDIDIAISKDKDFLSYNTAYSYFQLISDIKKEARINFHKNIDIFDLDSKSSFKNSIEKELIYV
jgi:predicted nucleotidyltransferase